MSYYTGHIRELFLHPQNTGEVYAADAVGDTGSLVCGAALRLTLRIDAAAGRITEARFKAAGCGYLIASASAMTLLLDNLSIAEAVALTVMLEEVLAEQLGECPAEKRHCASLCRDALGAALTGYRQSHAPEEWTGDEALICTCFGVSERTIEREVRAGALETIEQVTRACNAGGGCGSCHPLIADILDDYWQMEGPR